MAKALETVFKDFRPSPLQQAAIDRIHEFQDELKKYGMYVRSAIELEFMVQDGSGRLVSGSVDLEQAHQYLSQGERLPFIDKVEYEGRVARRLRMPEIATQYEVSVSDQIGKAAMEPRGFAPAVVAAVAQRMKACSLSSMLKEGTCLSADWIHRAELMPDFRAYPYTGEGRDAGGRKPDTSSLHINVSLYDRDGNNLFAVSDKLLDHCAASLLAVQDEAGLSMLPNENSLQRIGANDASPSLLKILRGRFVPDNEYPSICIRKPTMETLPMRMGQIRIENRLPGADADPFVAMAVTMAALVDAVKKNVKLVPQGEGRKVGVKVAPFVKVSDEQQFATHEIPAFHADLVRKLESSARMKELLGNALYSEILRNYGGGPEQARAH